MITTKHPVSDTLGAQVPREHYHLVKGIMLEILEEVDEIGFLEFGSRVSEEIEDKVEGSPMWYFTVIKLDLEKRRVISVNRNIRPQRIKLNGNHKKIRVKVSKGKSK